MLEAKFLRDQMASWFQSPVSYTHLLRCPVFSRSIEKIKDTVPQASLNSKQRHDNMQNAFRVSPQAPTFPISALIVDDVWTTGSTVKELASVLKIHGVKNVVVCTLARRWYNTDT